MYTKLVYFDTKTNSIKGTIRSLLAIPLVIILYIAWIYITDHHIPWYRFIIPIFVLVSALGVELSKSRNESVVYGGLVGFVVFGTIAGLYGTTITRGIGEILLGMGFCALTSLFIYSIY